MKKKQKKEYINGLNRILKSQDSNLSQKEKALIISVREGIKYSTNKNEILELLLKLALIFAGILDLKDLI